MRGVAIVAVFVGLLAEASSPSLAFGAPEDDAKIAQAKQHMEAGAAFYNDPGGPKCEEAVAEFSKAYDLSGSLKALRGRAICELLLERDGDAIADFEAYLARKTDITKEDRDQVESDLKKLKSAVAELAITTNVETRIIATRNPSEGMPKTNRYTVPAGGKKLLIHPGAYTITASADGFPEQKLDLEVPNGGKLDRAFTFAKPDEAPKPEIPKPTQEEAEGERPIPITFWIFGGVTVAAAVPMTIFMVRSGASKSDFDEANGRASEAELEDLRSDVITNNVVADVCLGVTAASATAAVIFLLTRPTVEPEKPAAAFVGVVPSFSFLPHDERVGATLLGTF